MYNRKYEDENAANRVQFNQVFNLLSIYLNALLAILYGIFERLKIYFRDYLFFMEKSVKNQIVIITGSGGYLGKFDLYNSINTLTLVKKLVCHFFICEIRKNEKIKAIFLSHS
jgi:hypothetical protein